MVAPVLNRAPREPLPPAWHGRAEPPVRGERILAALDRLFLRLEAFFARALPEALNPIARTGAMAVVSFLIAAVTGVVILIWYSPSVHQAYASVTEMDGQRFGAGLLRSVHRYSADAAMAFVCLHALRLFAQRRFGGARKLAWITGVILIASLWFVGWVGYWLVWDARAKEVALLTAKLMDVLPIFADPLSRSFLTDQGVNSLLFFVVFFFHMLVPLAMALPLWLHITRLSRPKFLTGLKLSAIITAAFALFAIAFPISAAGPARMTEAAHPFSFDVWYLLPLTLTGKLGPVGLWALAIGGLGLALLPPWLLQNKRAAAAKVDTSACNNCRLCFEDCPYEAITMVPRTDGRRFAAQAEVDPDKCVGCGICTGSCDPGAIELPDLAILSARRRVDDWLTEGVQLIAFACTSSAGDALTIDAVSGTCGQLPGYRVLPVPCAGWVERTLLERICRRGGKVLIVGCGPGECSYREGAEWTALRLDGERKPSARPELVPASSVRFVRADRQQLRALREEAAAFREGNSGTPPKRSPWLALIAVPLISAAILLPTAAPWAAPPGGSELVVSFKHPGQSGQHCRKVSEEEKAKLPVHMRQDQICERGRASVKLRVVVDGANVLERSYPPRGLSSDGNSIALERLALSPGEHRVSIALDDSGEGHWSYTDERAITVSLHGANVVLFDRLEGFRWFGGGDE